MKNNKGKGKAKTHKNKQNEAAPKPKGKCFHYKHWLRNCKKYLDELKKKKQGKLNLLIIETCLAEKDFST